MKTFKIRYAEAVTNIYEREVEARDEKEARSFFLGEYSEKDLVDSENYGEYSEFLECKELRA